MQDVKLSSDHALRLKHFSKLFDIYQIKSLQRENLEPEIFGVN